MYWYSSVFWRETARYMQFQHKHPLWSTSTPTLMISGWKRQLICKLTQVHIVPPCASSSSITCKCLHHYSLSPAGGERVHRSQQLVATNNAYAWDPRNLPGQAIPGRQLHYKVTFDLATSSDVYLGDCWYYPRSHSCPSVPAPVLSCQCFSSWDNLCAFPCSAGQDHSPTVPKHTHQAGI